MVWTLLDLEYLCLNLKNSTLNPIYRFELVVGTDYWSQWAFIGEDLHVCGLLKTTLSNLNMVPFVKLEADQPDNVVKCRLTKMIYQTQAEDGIHFVYPLIQKDHKIILAHTFEVKLLKQN